MLPPMESQYDSSKESFGDEITGLLVAPAFQPASPDAGSMPASGDLAFGATWHAPSRMFCSDGFGAGLKGFRDFLRLWRGIEPRLRRAGWKAGGPSEPRLRRAGWKAGGPSGIERAESTGVEFSGNFSGDKRRSE
ncbi:MAG: hypothetical protein N838_20520 [Thiohalocapsa sp. PB-PSB1]|jgi:hypothetical protein|nr:MAG: hypothetical protein N838_26925 [Thiohalocapsa sp. PB-PSB1]QQO55374.1 MAG: hypothetical protein N838_20520 [Thiohalocapsa sp. PB-PSB1]HCS92799.1 hypothetical protein [Chromatiaceae bacterium]